MQFFDEHEPLRGTRRGITLHAVLLAAIAQDRQRPPSTVGLGDQKIMRVCHQLPRLRSAQVQRGSVELSFQIERQFRSHGAKSGRRPVVEGELEGANMFNKPLGAAPGNSGCSTTILCATGVRACA